MAGTRRFLGGLRERIAGVDDGNLDLYGVRVRPAPTSPPPGPVRPPAPPPWNGHRIVAADFTGGMLTGMVCSCGRCLRAWQFTNLEVAAQQHVETGQ